MSYLGVAQLGTIGPHEVAARSRAELDRPLLYDAELTLGLVGEDAVLLGAFQRPCEIEAPHPRLVFRRISGGPAARVGQGTIWMSLALANKDALIPCEPTKIVQRHIRPLLRALTKLGRPAVYADREAIMIANRPAALVGFAHDTETGRTTVEAILAVSTPYGASKRSVLDKAPGTLEQLHGKRVDAVNLCGAIAESFAEEHLLEIEPLAIAPVGAAEGTVPRDDPPWDAMVEEALGPIRAGRDADHRMRIGGELRVSRDALASLESAVEALGPFGSRADVARAVDQTLGPLAVAIQGVRALGSIATVIVKAIDASR